MNNAYYQIMILLYFVFQPNLNMKGPLERSSLRFVENKENVVFVGSSGVSKAHLATILGICCTKTRHQTYFSTLKK